MKKILALLLSIPGFSLAQESVVVEKSVVCARTNIVLETLKETYKEEPVWLGNGNDRSRYSIFVNPKNGQFTIVQFNQEIACILGAGNSSVNIPVKPTL